MNNGVDEPVTEPDEQVEQWLRAISPPVTSTSKSLNEDLAAMAHAISSAERPSLRRRHALVATILAPMLVLGGAGAAFAATTVDWSAFWGDTTTTEWADWAHDPDASVNYSLPGGGSCELRLGEFQLDASARSVDAVLEYLHTDDVLTDADIAGVIQENRADENWADDGSGTPVRFGFGTDHYNADVEYTLAVKEAVQEAIIAHLDGLGLPSNGLSFQSQEQCTGMAQ